MLLKQEKGCEEMTETPPRNREHKRWIALVLAIILLLVSGRSQLYANRRNTSKNQDLLQEFTQGKSLSEQVIQQGNKDARIAVIPIHGVIYEGSSSSFMQGPTYYHQHVIDSIKAIQEDSSVKGVVLDINSPGGTVYHSAEVYERLLALKEATGIPIYASFKSMAASGGYYIAAAADKIYASNQETVTGSIGVISSGFNYSQLLENLGIEDQSIKSHDHKDIGSSTREMTEEEEAILQEEIDQVFQRFVDVVDAGRTNLTREEVLKLADGRTYDGAQALENGLVDAIAYEETVFNDLAESLNITSPEIFYYLQIDDLFGLGQLGSLLQGQVNKPMTQTDIPNLQALINEPLALYIEGGSIYD
ncbi:signal peptide peptidase SppA [Suicoccus acidiformans]|uniref:Signal peptide peptidase SppA n=2 Tax=Suicoccus acidiformans TaxID=2036206 RepID=A0A347WHN5_9LACT|nr:signal peptide peptidase SppA [Suicoccus acidiformans]